MEYEIGQEIELLHNSETIKLKIEEDKTINCKNCFFRINKHDNCTKDVYYMEDAYCTSMFRNDNKNIIFKQIK